MEGNPTNVGSHYILSICDAHVLEKLSGGNGNQNNKVQIAYKRYENYKEQHHNKFYIFVR